MLLKTDNRFLFEGRCTRAGKCLMLTGILLYASGVNSVYAAIVAGAVTDAEEKPTVLEESSEPVRPAVVPPASATLINFDDITAPCYFYLTTALRDHYYAAYGVTFEGPGGNDGGAILNECGSFGVSGHSSPNFLAFNTTGLPVQMTDGGYPIGPESISFETPVGSVFLNAGGAAAGTVTLECYNPNGVSVGFDTITGADALQPLAVSGSKISRCDITFSGTWLVVDDLAFIPFKAKDMPWIRMLLL